MISLDEIIEVFKKPIVIFPGSQGSPEVFYADDVLYYLKMFKDIIDVSHEHGCGSIWGIEFPEPEKIKGKPDFREADNPPLTWNQLTELIDKPVWIYEKWAWNDSWTGSWRIISDVAEYIEDAGALYTKEDDVYDQDEMGETWIAYRRERNE